MQIKVKKLRTYYEYAVKYISMLRSDNLRPLDIMYLVEILLLPEKYKYAPFSFASKRYIGKIFEASPQVVNNHIYTLIEKGYLVRDSDNVIQLSTAMKELRDKNPVISISYEKS